MRLIHTTRRCNEGSIHTSGLDLNFARNLSCPRIWFHTPELNGWAECHVRERHSCYEEDLMHLECEVPEDLVKTFGSVSGVYYIETGLMPGLIVSRQIVTRKVW